MQERLGNIKRIVARKLGKKNLQLNISGEEKGCFRMARYRAVSLSALRQLFKANSRKISPPRERKMDRDGEDGRAFTSRENRYQVRSVYLGARRGPPSANALANPEIRPNKKIDAR